MNPTLPIMVDCPPYSGRLILERCIERFHIANGGAWKKGDGGGQAAIDTARLRASRCRGCEIGAERKRASAETPAPPSVASGLSRAQRATKTNRAAAAALKRELIVVDPAATSAPHEEDEMVGKCSKCETKNKKLPTSGVCLKCSRAAAKASTPAAVSKAKRDAPTPKQSRELIASPLLSWMSKSSAIEALKLRHEEELAKALRELVAFEKQHPEIRTDAQHMLERLVTNS